jgi:hypothetical protein
VNAFQWCLVLSVAFVIALAFVSPAGRSGPRMVLGVLAAVALLLAVLIGTGVIPTAG